MPDLWPRAFTVAATATNNPTVSTWRSGIKMPDTRPAAARPRANTFRGQCAPQADQNDDLGKYGTTSTVERYRSTSTATAAPNSCCSRRAVSRPEG